jgi:hypothetical protein
VKAQRHREDTIMMEAEMEVSISQRLLATTRNWEGARKDPSLEHQEEAWLEAFLASNCESTNFYFFFSALEFELRAAHLLGRHSDHLSHSTSSFL